MQDLVGVRVADAAEDPRVGQRALERVVLPGERVAECRQVRVKDLEAARVVLAQTGFATDEMQRGPPFRARLGQDHRPRREVEAGETDLSRQLGARGLPMEAARDHEVQNEKEVALESNHDALAEPSEPGDPAAGRVRQRRVDGTEQERARDPRALQPGAGDARFESFDVDDDVRQLRHLGILGRAAAYRAIRA